MAIDGNSNVGVGMHGVDNFDIVPASEPDEGRAYLIEAAAEAFTAMRRDDDEFLRGVGPEFIEASKLPGIESMLDLHNRVNARISADSDGALAHAFTIEVSGGSFGRGEVKG